MSSINKDFFIILFCFSIWFSCDTARISNFNTDVIVDSVLFEKGFTELSPLIEKYNCKFHYEKGVFALSLPFVGSFFRIDSLGSVSKLTSNYAINDLQSTNLRMMGVSFNGDLFNGQYYSYFFSKVDEIRILDVNTGDLVKIPSRLKGSVLHSDVYKASDRILFSRYGKSGNDLVFQVMEVRDGNTFLLYSIELDGPLGSFPPFITSYNDDYFYFLKQGSDTLFTIDFNKAESEFSKKLQFVDNLNKDYLGGKFNNRLEKITYSELRVFNDTVFVVSNLVLIDSIGEKSIERILTIESNDYFNQVHLPESFLGLGPRLNYFSLEYVSSERFLFLRPIKDLKSN